MTPFSPTGIVVVPGTDYWVVEGDTHLGAWAIQKRDIVTDPNLFRFLEPHLKAVDTVWDIGASIGDHALQYCRWGKYVVAIEPHPIAYECLKHNVPEALCLNFAASDTNGTVNMMGYENVGASRIRPDGEWTVPAMRLDDHPDLPAPGFVKLDVEGHEPSVLKGMRNVLEQHRPILFIEINRGALAEQGFTPADVYSLLTEVGYDVEAALVYPPNARLDSEQFDLLFLP